MSLQKFLSGAEQIWATGRFLILFVQFFLPLEFASRSAGSSAFAAGQVRRQVRPEGA